MPGLSLCAVLLALAGQAVGSDPILFHTPEEQAWWAISKDPLLEAIIQAELSRDDRGIAVAARRELAGGAVEPTEAIQARSPAAVGGAVEPTEAIQARSPAAVGGAVEPEASPRAAETLRDAVNNSSEPPLEQPGSADEVIEPKVVGPVEPAKPPASPLCSLDERTREKLNRSAEDEASKLVDRQNLKRSE